MGPIIILDKSAIQSLSQNEIFHLFKHYYINVPPILLIEILADLKKRSDDSLSEKDVTILANKLLSLDSKVNVYYKDICLGSLFGSQIPMTGQILIGGGVELQTQNGEKGMFFDEPVEMKALRNWQDGKFSDSEKLLAERWRTSIKEINLDLYKEKLKELFKGLENRITNFKELGLYVDEIISNPDSGFQLSCIKYFVNEIQIPNELSTGIYNRWVNNKMQNFRVFAPYAFYCFRANAIFYLGLFFNLVTTRATNLIDLEYFYYLPFCWVFASGDKFHKNMSESLLRNDQMYIDSRVLKSDLQWLANEWSNLNEDERENRSYEYGSYPPDNLYSITCKLWVKYMRPRTSGSGNRKMTKEQEKEVIQQIKPFMDAIDEYEKNRG